MSQVGRLREVVCARVYQRVSEIRAVDVPALFCIYSSCNHVTEAGGP